MSVQAPVPSDNEDLQVERRNPAAAIARVPLPAARAPAARDPSPDVFDQDFHAYRGAILIDGSAHARGKKRARDDDDDDDSHQSTLSVCSPPAPSPSPPPSPKPKTPKRKKPDMGHLADGSPAVARRVRYDDILEWRKLKEVHDAGLPVPDNLEQMITTVCFRKGVKEVKPEHQHIVKDLRARLANAVWSRLGKAEARADQAEEGNIILADKIEKLKKRLADAKKQLATAKKRPAAAAKSAQNKVTGPPAAAPAPFSAHPSRPQNVSRQVVELPMRAMRVVGELDMIIEAGIAAAVAADGESIQAWINEAVNRDEPKFK